MLQAKKRDCVPLTEFNLHKFINLIIQMLFDVQKYFYDRLDVPLLYIKYGMWGKRTWRPIHLTAIPALGGDLPPSSVVVSSPPTARRFCDTCVTCGPPHNGTRCVIINWLFQTVHFYCVPRTDRASSPTLQGTVGQDRISRMCAALFLLKLVSIVWVCGIWYLSD